MKVIRKIINIDEELCNGCGNCVPSCAEGALEIVDGKARVVADIYCDGLGACLGECPTGALTVQERTADEFDEHAVEERLARAAERNAPGQAGAAHGAAAAPRPRLQSFGRGTGPARRPRRRPRQASRP